MKTRRSVRIRALSALLALVLLLAAGGTVLAQSPTAYNASANITVGKTLTTAQAGIWPDVTAFTFTLTADHYTAGPDTAQTSSGYTAYTNANMPMPAAGTGNTAASGTPLASTITVSGFNTADTGTSQTIKVTTGNAAYTQTGVYTYKLQEVVPNPVVPGVTYDNSLYYVNVYVTNVLNNDGTPLLDANGKAVVTVSNITAYKAVNGATDPTAADNGGNAPVADAVTGKTEIVTPGDGDGTVRNIEYPFKNLYTSANISVSKKVTGTLADPQKDFTFQLALTNALGAADGRTYSYKVYSMGADETAYTADDTELTAKAGTITNSGTFTLRHNQYIVIAGLAAGETYTVTEQGAADYTTTVTPQNGTAAGTAAAGKTAGEQALSTETNAFNRTAFVNNKDAVTPTGVLLDVLPYVLILCIACAALIVLFRKRRNADR